jgi:hypothetical protein
MILTLFPRSDCEELKQLYKYEKLKFKQYNHVILNDSGIPDIMKVINDVKRRMDDFLLKKSKMDDTKNP